MHVGGRRLGEGGLLHEHPSLELSIRAHKRKASRWAGLLLLLSTACQESTPASRLSHQAGLAPAVSCAGGPEAPPPAVFQRTGASNHSSAAIVGPKDCAQTDIEKFYSQNHLPRIDLRLSPEAWQGLLDEPREYQPGVLIYQGDEWPDVGIRLKGRNSFRTLEEKPSFKIKVNEFRKGQRFGGRRRLTLNNTVQDPSMLRERLGYLLLREAGVEAPRCNHAEVYVNGKYFGLYVNLETMDVEFVEAHYPKPHGNLYDLSGEIYNIDINRDDEPPFWRLGVPAVEDRFVLKTNKLSGDTSDLAQLIDKVSGGPDATWIQDAESVLDLDQWLRVGAVQGVIADWDSYFGGTNNYKLYNETGRDRFVLLPWGIDQTFGIRKRSYEGAGYRIDGSNSGRSNGLIFERCKQSETCFARYLVQVRGVLEAWARLGMEDRIAMLLAQVGPLIESDPRRPQTLSAHRQAVRDLQTFLVERPAEVQGQLAGARKSLPQP